MIGEGRAQLTDSSTASLPAPAVLDLCDRHLKEVGRRKHLFAWLRAPGAGTEDWLVVDAYYPGNRLVVICRDQPAEHDELYRELVPAHGLRLLEIVPAQLGTGPEAATRALAEMIAGLGPAPERPQEVITAPASPKPRRRREGPSEASRRRAAMEAAVLQAASSLAQPPPQSAPRRASAAQAAAMLRASRLAENHKLKSSLARPRPVQPVARKPPIARAPVRRVKREVAPVGLLAGIALVVLLVVEMTLNVAVVAVDHGWVLLAFGIALEAVARALGTIASGRAGRRGWAWGCALGGIPAVAAFTLFQKDGPVATDPAPLAGLMSLFAGAVIALGALVAALNI